MCNTRNHTEGEKNWILLTVVISTPGINVLGGCARVVVVWGPVLFSAYEFIQDLLTPKKEKISRCLVC